MASKHPTKEDYYKAIRESTMELAVEHLGAIVDAAAENILKIQKRPVYPAQPKKRRLFGRDE